MAFLLVFILYIFLHSVSSDDTRSYCHASKPKWPPTPRGFRLLQTQVLVRHADRTPKYYEERYDHYHFDCQHPLNWPEFTNVFQLLSPTHLKYILPSLLPEGSLTGGCRTDELTVKGWNQAVQLGASLRKQYGSFVPRHYDADKVQVSSATGVANLQTALGILWGLYGAPRGDQLWQVVYYPDGADMFQPFDRCPSKETKEMYDDIMNQPLLRSWATERWNPYMEGIMMKLSSTVKMDRMLTEMEIFNIWDTFMCAGCNSIDFKPYEGIGLGWLADFAFESHILFALLSNNTLDSQRYGGALPLSEVLQHIKPLTRKERKPNFSDNSFNESDTEVHIVELFADTGEEYDEDVTPFLLWSMDDQALINIVTKFGIHPPVPILGYLTTLIIEIHEHTKTKKKYVRMVFDGMCIAPKACQTEDAPDDWCTLEQWIKIASPPPDWSNKCWNKKRFDL